MNVVGGAPGFPSSDVSDETGRAKSRSTETVSPVNLRLTMESLVQELLDTIIDRVPPSHTGPFLLVARCPRKWDQQSVLHQQPYVLQFVRIRGSSLVQTP